MRGLVLSMQLRQDLELGRPSLGRKFNQEN